MLLKDKISQCTFGKRGIKPNTLHEVIEILIVVDFEVYLSLFVRRIETDFIGYEVVLRNHDVDWEHFIDD